MKETDAWRTRQDGRERDGPIFNELAMNSPSGTERRVA
jgi:hypothetical protein